MRSNEGGFDMLDFKRSSFLPFHPLSNKKETNTDVLERITKTKTMKDHHGNTFEVRDDDSVDCFANYQNHNWNDPNPEEADVLDDQVSKLLAWLCLYMLPCLYCKTGIKTKLMPTEAGDAYDPFQLSTEDDVAYVMFYMENVINKLCRDVRDLKHGKEIKGSTKQARKAKWSKLSGSSSNHSKSSSDEKKEQQNGVKFRLGNKMSGPVAQHRFKGLKAFVMDQLYPRGDGRNSKKVTANRDTIKTQLKLLMEAEKQWKKLQTTDKDDDNLEDRKRKANGEPECYLSKDIQDEIEEFDMMALDHLLEEASGKREASDSPPGNVAVEEDLYKSEEDSDNGRWGMQFDLLDDSQPATFTHGDSQEFFKGHSQPLTQCPPSLMMNEQDSQTVTTAATFATARQYL